MGYEIQLTDLSRRPTAVVRAQVAPADLTDFLGGAFEEVLAVVGRQGRSPAGPPFGRYVLHDGAFDATVGFPVDGEVAASGRVTPDELPGGTAATTLHTGPYDQVGAAYDALTAWLPEHGLTASGVPWESYLDGPDVPVPRTAVHLPCREAS